MMNRALSQIHILGALLLFTACSREEFMPRESGSGMVRLETCFADQTRVSTDEAFNSVMVEGDQMGVFAVVRTNATVQAYPASVGNYAHNARWIYTGGSWQPASSADAIYYPVNGMPLDFYVYHPYVAGADPTDIPYNASTQMSDLITARAAGVTASNDPVRLQFRHKLALVELQTTTSSPTITLQPSTSVNLSATTQARETGMASGSATAVAMTPYIPGKYRAYVPPQTVAAGAKLFNMTFEGASYGYTLPAAVTLAASHVKQYTVNPQTVEVQGEANCYLVTPGGTVNIPVSQAYRGWATAPLNTTLPGAGSTTATLTCSIVWQDADGLISSVAAVGNNSTGYIQVKVNGALGNGNAVVALRINGTICWSWHIWVTDYIPGTTGATPTYRGYTLMDRNLGAKNATAGNAGSIGTYYQWGRKDPMPGPASWALAPSTVWLTNGTSTTVTPTTGVVAGAVNNLTTSIRNPRTFITTGGNYPFDWYSTTPNDGDDRWGGLSGVKSVFDPCPQGWRVPVFDASNELWSGLNYNSAYNNGWVFTDIGYYPAGGKINDNNGVLSTAGQGFLWYTTPEDYADYSFNFYQYVMQRSNQNRGTGVNVRCVEE